MIEALYVHVPFCVARCAYCDFATNACDDEARMDAYVDALCMQIRRAARSGLLGAVKTIYIGGGTPTHLGARRLNSLVYMISLSVNLEDVVEFTVEANPESIDERMVADLFALGVNRFSIGAQSFDEGVLSAYGRVHDVRQIEQAVECVKMRTDAFSLDLICGGPGQSMQSWARSVQRALELGVQHVSVYPLTLEEGTPLFRRVEAGECMVADEDTQAQMMLCAAKLLEKAGLMRYEVASYAKPGSESLHNSAYWTGVEYLGLGAGAASMLTAEGARAAFDAGLFDAELEAAEVDTATDRADTSEVSGCLGIEAKCDRDALRAPARYRFAANADDVAFCSSHGKPRVDVETLTSREAAIEDLMLGMRMSVGVSRERVLELSDALPVFEELCAKGLVAEQHGRFVPTDRGWLMGNEIFGAIWALAGESTG